MRTYHIELIRPVERIGFRRTENIDVQFSHLFLLGYRGILRIVVILYIGRVGLLGRCPTLLSLRLHRFGGLVVGRISFCLTAIVCVSWNCLAFPFLIRSQRLGALLPGLASIGLLSSLLALALPACE
jgi:hypothetical protein